jgi:molybdenum cofactor cytidylyltransferase
VRYADFAPVILAAGASSRMGRPKDQLQFEGVTALDLALRKCRDAGCGAPIVVTRGEREAEIRAQLGNESPFARVVVNHSPELGQTSSLRIGLAALPEKTRAFLVFPVDFPLIRASDVEALCRIFDGAEQYSSMKPNAVSGTLEGSQAPRDGAPAAKPPAPHAMTRVDVVVPSFARRRGHPVLVNVALAEAIRRLPPDGSARDVLSAPDLYTIYMEVDDDRVLTDMDTPQAYADCLARYRAG